MLSRPSVRHFNKQCLKTSLSLNHPHVAHRFFFHQYSSSIYPLPCSTTGVVVVVQYYVTCVYDMYPPSYFVSVLSSKKKFVSVLPPATQLLRDQEAAHLDSGEQARLPAKALGSTSRWSSSAVADMHSGIARHGVVAVDSGVRLVPTGVVTDRRYGRYQKVHLGS